ncbi:MAG TPA: FkbM family methyltransferase [Terracidiphilus sp.]
MIRARQVLRPARYIRSLCQRLRKPNARYAKIGRYQIRLPANGQLLDYKAAFSLYDTALGKIASVLRVKYPGLRAIDVGANVGDTAALIREFGDIPVLCIEGDPSLLPLLQENVVRLGPGLEIEHSFVGPDGAGINLGVADGLGRNACLAEAVDERGAVKLRSLRTILASHPDFAGSKLLKTDTEGFDFDILRQSLEFIRRARPVVFSEYDPHFRPAEGRAGPDTIRLLVDAGYSDLIYYDNFGNFLLHIEANCQRIVDDLDAYLASNRRHGIAVHYFDICALHQEDSDLVPAIRALTQK